ncbi:MAG: carbon-nitrogen hydrolase family protein [Halobacteriota archaeon]|nr:carbon-nitrogen hydrolase family protein [Halobacteriota archaeon]
MRINIAQIEYDPIDVDRIKEVLNGLDGITCFPECFAIGRSGVETLQYLNKVGDQAEHIKEEVKKTGKTVILPLVEKHPLMRNRFYNTTYVMHNNELIGSYRRVVIHPMEDPFVQAGKEFPVFEYDDVIFGVLVCFEIAFPELTRIIALKGASIIFAPASSPEEADYLWNARMQARAIDNQLFVVGVNRCGQIGNEKYLGRSIVISPSGEITHECGNEEEIVSIEIHLDEINVERSKEPTFSEFEIEVYDKSMKYFKEG